MKLDYSIPREQVPEPDETVRWTIEGNDRAATRVIPHAAHEIESWHYDSPTGNLISYFGSYAMYQNPKYPDRPFPKGVELQRWNRAKCRCPFCVPASDLRITVTR